VAQKPRGGRDFVRKKILFCLLAFILLAGSGLGIAKIVDAQQTKRMQEQRNDLEQRVTVEKIDLLSPYCEYLSQEEFAQKGHVSLAEQYSSDVSVAYKNKDTTTTLYVFANPIS
jgi:hypothetical protein